VVEGFTSKGERMANIFGNLELEAVVQTKDKTRLNASKSFSPKGEQPIDQVKISPETGVALIAVHGAGNPKDWFLDWEYATAGTKTVTLEIKAGPHTVTFTRTIEVVTPEQDKLFSKDSDLIQFEPDILKWLPAGKSTYNNIHRNAQYLIIDWLDSIRVWRTDGTKLTKADLSLTDDLKQLSIYMTLELIFMSISNQVDDVFLNKARMYGQKALLVQGRGRIQADLNGNGTLDTGEAADLRSFTLVRR
jgi:hypothetical protein